MEFEEKASINFDEVGIESLVTEMIASVLKTNTTKKQADPMWLAK